MTRVFALLVSCAVTPLVFVVAAGVATVPAWLMVLSLTFWAGVIGVSVWQNHFGLRPQPVEEIKQPLRWSHRAGPPAL
jgi:hypothetical protein